ncbi:MAG: ABC transporter substrate-binding protein [Gaiellales bacterium]|jgi:ABC-type transport system substrate-binding protein/class 3 adenylate cyclase/type II secretory pathway predicted ATPase ExeA|nr:ABC transporter substrate-binding protein [Gaiellales bacterium]
MERQDAERRVVTVLMADLVGSTAIAERLGPERARFLLDEVVSVMTEEVYRFGGTVAQLAGDGMLALFGAPVANEDDPQRAARAALAIRSSLERYGHEVRDAYGIEVAVRQALNTGVVVVAPSSAGDNPYNALGDTVNVAARLQAQAAAGEILAGGDTHRLICSWFDLEDVGDADLRGREQPVSAHRLVAEGGDAESERRLPLVGRDYELSLLTRVMSDLREGLGSIVVVTGEPGIGKTRLVGEALRESHDIVVLEGHGVSYASGFPLWPVRDVIRGWLGASPAASEAQLRLDLKARLAPLFDGEEDPFPYLARVVGIRTDAESSELRELSGDALNRQTLEAIERLLVRISRDHPVCLVLEDLHWADDRTLDLLQRMYELTEREAISLVLLYRSERDAPSWAVGERARQRYPHRYREIELRPLAEDAARRLAIEAAGGAMPDDAASAVAERAGGNPLFISEAVRDQAERGEGAELDAVPGAVQGALQARFDRLSPPARGLLSVAAVIGRRFTLPILERVAPDLDVSAGLSDLQRAELIVERQRRPAPVYTFRHGLVQEAAYNGLLDSRRVQLHRQVAEGLEELLREEEGLVPLPLLAYHWSAAECPDQAADYLIRAGDEARRMYASDDAVVMYRKARSFLARTDDERRSRETLFKIALVHHLAFRFSEAERAYDEAFCCRDEPLLPPTPTESLWTAIRLSESLAPGHAYSTEAAAVSSLLFRGLLEVDQELNVMPSLADNLRVESDGLTYMFRIREDARWSDGEPVTAHDFEYTWTAMREQNVTTAFLLDDIARAEALDDRTLEVELHEPRPYFPYLLAAPPLFPWPKHVVERLGDDWLTPRNLVGNGPYEVASFEDDRLTLTASPTWAGSRGNVAEILFEIRSSDDLVDRFRDGDFDVLAGKDVDAATVTGGELSVIPSLGTTILGLRPKGALRDPLVRRAVARAVSLGTPTNLRGDRAAGEGGVLPPAMPGHQRRIWHQGEDPADMLVQAGHAGGAGVGPLRLYVRDALAPLATEIADRLGSIGIVTEVHTEGGYCHPGEADLWLSSWVADFPDPDGFFRGLLDKETFLGQDDEELQELMTKARSSRDRDERLELYGKIDRLLVADRALLVPVGYKRLVILSRPWVSGLWATPLMPACLAETLVDAQLKAASMAASSAAGTA